MSIVPLITILLLNRSNKKLASTPKKPLSMKEILAVPVIMLIAILVGVAIISAAHGV